MDNIFGYFVNNGVKNDKQLAYTGWFTENFPAREFEGDERLFWYFCDFCVKLGVSLKYSYLETWLSTEVKKHLLNENIKVVGCEALNYNDPVAFETAYKITCDVLKDNYKVLSDLQLNYDDFPVSASAFINTQKKKRLTECLSKTFNIMSDTEDSEKASAYAMGELNLIDLMYNPVVLEPLGIVSTDSTVAEFVTDTGLPGIDNDSGGIFKGQCVGIEAQPGTGKTRLTLGHIVYRAAVKYHKNCLFYSLEQSVGEIDAMLIARHVFTLFGIIINDILIYQNAVPDEYKQQVEAARLDLFESGKYGKIVRKEEIFSVETFVQTIKNHDRLLGPFDLVAIDYMGLFESTPLDKYRRYNNLSEIIGDAYKYFKRYCRTCRKAGIAVGQLNREGIAAGEADKVITTEMAQGGIAVYRNTDYNIAITMSNEMKARHQRRFSQPKVRSTAGFGTFIADTKLGACYFQQVARKEV